MLFYKKTYFGHKPEWPSPPWRKIIKKRFLICFDFLDPASVFEILDMALVIPEVRFLKIVFYKSCVLVITHRFFRSVALGSLVTPMQFSISNSIGWYLEILKFYNPPFKPINRPWDRSRSIDFEEIYNLMDQELHSSYRMLACSKTRSTYSTLVLALAMDTIHG